MLNVCVCVCVPYAGVVNAILNFHQFDEQVATAIGTTCANTLRATTAAFEQAIA